MAGKSLQQANLNFSLTFFSEELSKRNIEHFIFFGTLLGMERNGAPIEGDDDVDFYVNKHYYELVKGLIADLGIKIDYKERKTKSEWFCQVKAVIGIIDVQVDFYFYDSTSDENFILEYWNFAGTPDNKRTVLKTPKPLIFPLINVDYKGSQIFLPRYPKIICEFLYGIDWRIPQKKRVDYIASTLGGRPFRFQKNIKGGIKILP